MLFNEPKLLKSGRAGGAMGARPRFSALQRAEIAEIWGMTSLTQAVASFSALQRAEIAEIVAGDRGVRVSAGFQCSSTSRNC